MRKARILAVCEYSQAVTIRVCIDYRMSRGDGQLLDVADNCVTISITKKAYAALDRQQDCVAGQQVKTMLLALVKLQGYDRLESWGIEEE